MPATGKSHLKPVATKQQSQAGTESRSRTETRFRGTRLPVELDQQIEFLAEVYETTITDIVKTGMSEFIARQRQSKEFKARLAERKAKQAQIEAALVDEEA